MRKREGAILSIAAMALLLSAQLIGSPAASASLPAEADGRAVPSAVDSVSPKTAVVACPAGERVVGGGGWIFATTAGDYGKLVLTGLEAVHSGKVDKYIVTAKEVDPGVTGAWWLVAYAFCAPAPAR